MQTISVEIAGRKPVRRVAGRTPDELLMLVNFLRDEPDTWYVYSIHINLAAAHTRASQLRKVCTPATLLPFMDNLEFKSTRHAAYGPVVLVRWRITEGTVPALP
jgi:hypothetical protein